VTFVIDADLEIGAPLRAGPMTLFPLLQASGPEPRAYVCGPEADGALAIEEQRGGVVAELRARNLSDRPVLLIEGELVLGAKQDRVLNVSVLLASRASATLPVSCVEAGRWGSAKPSTRSSRHSPPRLRARKTRSVIESSRSRGLLDSNQGAVWAEVAAYEEAVGALSPSSALRDVQDKAANEVERLAPSGRPTAEQVGVIVASGGRPTVLELFDDPVSFDAYWRSLVSGYALDASLSGADDATTAEEAAAFLEIVRHITFESRPGVSLGDDVHAETDDVVATGIGWGGELLHLVCFASP
jgi:hypothetical protein